MHTAEIAAQVTAAAQELLQIGAVKAGQVFSCWLQYQRSDW